MKSELVKSQNEIDKFQKNDYYSLAISLEQENNLLTNQKKELSRELLNLKRTFEKEMNKLHEDIQSRENQRLKLISSIGALVQKKNELLEENKKLTKTIKETQNEEVAQPNLHSPEHIAKDYVKAIENIDNTLHDFIQKNSQQLSLINDELLKNRSEVIDINLYLLKEIKNKSSKIDMLMREIEDLKEQHYKQLLSFLDNKPTDSSAALPQLDTQVQNVLSQATNFEDQLDEKLRILDDLESELNQLAKKVDKHKVDN
ncbi:coiled-coil domain-containing protein 22 [Solibacillus sp. MA9]|uniref:Coiled-coil domain-containing protein 22 n=1 Tax=Solibacillus palustris TaxID=2908203 RepID=A0ABS9UFF5_9BACL|nr:coiled-coil domain-containing protein 22 [Solibacillus sp. MA9]MCH7323069.1 coiled-coil domain-containing protein 22 [Solibacillus sp. MA9]